MVRKFLDEGWRVEGFDLLPATVEENEHYRHTVGDFRDDESVEEFVENSAGVRHLVVIAGGAVDEEVACSDFVELSEEVIPSILLCSFCSGQKIIVDAGQLATGVRSVHFIA